MSSKTLVFTWEFGTGNGHILPLLELIRTLLKKHQCILITSSEVNPKLIPSGLIHRQIDLKYTPCKFPDHARTLMDKHINFGFGDIAFTHKVLDMYADILPDKVDMIISDWSPFAHLYAVIFDIPWISFNASVFTPPIGMDARLMQHEPQVGHYINLMERINQVATDLAHPLPNVYHYFNYGKRFITSYPWFDHYVNLGIPLDARMRQVEYVGYPKIEPIYRTVPATWPSHGSRRVLLYAPYLRNRYPSMITELTAQHASIIAFGCGHDIYHRLDPSIHHMVSVYPDPTVSILELLPTADMAIINGGNVAMECVKTATPMLICPIHPDQIVIADKLVRSGIAERFAPVKFADTLDGFMAHLTRYRFSANKVRDSVDFDKYPDPIGVVCRYIEGYGK